MRNIAILGSTGSIGTQTLDIVRSNSDLRVVTLSAGKNIKLLEAQMREFNPMMVCVWGEEDAKSLRESTKDLGIQVLAGMDGLIEAVCIDEVDVVVTAIVGMIGIRPTIEAIKRGKSIALANKETLVTAGHIIMPLAKKMGVNIFPVDSEHSAIFQSLNGENRSRLSKILLTASGGPFRGKDIEYLKSVRVEDALKHPNWEMGRKITIDSATLVNKGLEVIEAKWLFDLSLDEIEVVVHPQSIIHSMVEYVDGGVMAQMGMPDMRLPIQYALFYPDRRPMKCEKLDFFKLANMTFERPDIETFKGLKLALEACKIGDSMPTVYNATNEIAVALFLDRKISFLGITDLIEEQMQSHNIISEPTVEEILDIEKDLRERIMKGIRL